MSTPTLLETEFVSLRRRGPVNGRVNGIRREPFAVWTSSASHLHTLLRLRPQPRALEQRAFENYSRQPATSSKSRPWRWPPSCSAWPPSSANAPRRRETPRYWWSADAANAPWETLG